MAPSPEHDKEPKAPDKGHSQPSDNNSGDNQVQVSETQQNSDTIPAAAGANADTEESGQLESLDEGQLKALLDEAVNYKRPKDREGKSLLFKELLLKGEQDGGVGGGGVEPSCVWGARACGSASSRRRASRRGPHTLLAHSGSLQDLGVTHSVIPLSSSSHHQQLHQHAPNAGSGSHSNRRRANAHHNVVPVSARSLQGGSLPANVDQQNFGGVEGGRNFLDDVSPAYVATVCCVNPPPLGKDAPPSHGRAYHSSSPRPLSHVISADYMLVELPGSRRGASPQREPHSRAASASLTTNAADTPPAPYYHHDEDDLRLGGSHLEIRSSKSPRVPVNYTTTLEIGSSSSSSSITTLTVSSNHCSGSSHATSPICSTSYVDSSHGCISSTQVVPSSITSVNYSKDSSLVGITASPSSSSSSCGSSSAGGAGGGGGQAGTSSQVSYISSCSRISCAPKNDHTDLKKSFDENGNTVQGGSGQHSKKPKRKKCKNETETISNEIVGYRGSENLDVILKFIESNEGGGKNGKAKPNPPGLTGKPPTREGKARDDNDAAHDKAAKKRSTERRSKDAKNDKLKKANSMEELSRSKLHDLTDEPADTAFNRIDKRTPFRQPDTDAKRTDRRSWGNDGSDSYYSRQNGPSDDADDSFSADVSNGSSSSVTTNTAVKPKRPKTPRVSGSELEPAIIEPLTVETSDFQTVTNKKKIRKRHSPCDDTRGRSNNPHAHTNSYGKNPPRFGNNFTAHDRDGLYRRFGRAGSAERRHPSASSPPSDKSNDSNDDLDSVHSLPAEASGERLQASYADMARAATQPPPARPPPASSPPPPVVQNHSNVSSPAPAGHRNFPDLIESCNYYPNDRQSQDKYLDVSTENTKNLLLKGLAMDSVKTKINNGTVEGEMQTEQTDVSNPIYNHEQYPALEPRSVRPVDGKTPNTKSKIETKLSTIVANNNNGNGKILTQVTTIRSPPTEKKTPPSSKSLASQDEQTRIEDSTVDEDVEKVSEYQTIVNHSVSNVTSTDAAYGSDNNNAAKANFGVGKLDNFTGKPPDVILPSTELPQTDNRPAVIIMNEELKKSSERIHNIDGITFGFDINEQLLNGDISTIADNGSAKTDEAPVTILYNSNVEFPAINEKCSKKDTKDKSPTGRGEDAKSQPKSRVGKTSESEGHKEDVLVGQAKSLRYVAPVANPKDAYNLENIVRYVGMAWEDIMKSSGSKMPYFSKQQ